MESNAVLPCSSKKFCRVRQDFRSMHYLLEWKTRRLILLTLSRFSRRTRRWCDFIGSRFYQQGGYTKVVRRTAARCKWARQGGGGCIRSTISPAYQTGSRYRQWCYADYRSRLRFNPKTDEGVKYRQRQRRGDWPKQWWSAGRGACAIFMTITHLLETFLRPILTWLITICTWFISYDSMRRKVNE